MKHIEVAAAGWGFVPGTHLAADAMDDGLCGRRLCARHVGVCPVPEACLSPGEWINVGGQGLQFRKKGSVLGFWVHLLALQLIPVASDDTCVGAVKPNAEVPFHVLVLHTACSPDPGNGVSSRHPGMHRERHDAGLCFRMFTNSPVSFFRHFQLEGVCSHSHQKTTFHL